MSEKIDGVDEIQYYFKLCDKIKESDPKIRFVGVINELGRLVAGGMKEGVKPLESQKEDEMLFMELALKIKMRKEFDKQLGVVNFAMSQREKSLGISFLIGNSDVLCVFAEHDADYVKLVEKIRSMII